MFHALGSSGAGPTGESRPSRSPSREIVRLADSLVRRPRPVALVRTTLAGCASRAVRGKGPAVILAALALGNVLLFAAVVSLAVLLYDSRGTSPGRAPRPLRAPARQQSLPSRDKAVARPGTPGFGAE